ncbi:MAG: gliding motility-associated C-terminal domain-containing protein [Elusimicrobia bacterium]|nr:gliding motility-associated C-terminal domain-containing protein [Elusimicrobiota bacterium]
MLRRAPIAGDSRKKNTPSRNPLRTILFAAAATLLAQQPALAAKKLIGGTQSIPRFSISSGGLAAANANRSLNNAVSETGVSSFTSANYRLHTGLMDILAQPGSVASIVAVTKATGILELGWTAPGLDGAVGSGNGYYRIDASSDVLHEFRPTRFLVEFATNTAPGDSQSYALMDLEPNVTYYTRIYLSDERKVVSEDSRRSDESTLANVPDPVFSGVWSSSVTITWALPMGAAEGYRTDASSTNFGTLFPGGVVTTSQTANGVVVSLTLDNLDSYTTYYFKLGSLNWQSDVNYSVIIATRTLPGGPRPVQDLQLAGNGLNRTVLLTWTNPVFADPAGVTVLVSTNIITSAPVDTVVYQPGYAFPDSSIVADPAAATSHLKGGLELDVTTYFKLYSKNASAAYSLAVSTFVILDLPPLMAAGFDSGRTPDGSSITITWAKVLSNLDGSSFESPAAPSAWELDHYDIYRATSIVRSGWTLAVSTPVAATSAAAWIPDQSQVYYYKVVPRDAFDSGAADESMVVDTLGNLYAVGSDHVTRIKIPSALTPNLRPEGNDYNLPLYVRVKERPQDLGGKVVKSVMFEAYQSPSAKAAPILLSDSSMDVVLHYQTSGGQIVPSGFGPSSSGKIAAASGGRVASNLTPSVRAADASANLAAYLAQGADAVKLFGSVDSYMQTVQLQSRLLGNYQIRTVLRDMGFNFDVSGVSNRAITPNNDGLNDTVVFVFDNPKDSGFSGKVFDSRGMLVSDLKPGPLARNSLVWDGKSNGIVVPKGVYIYQLKAEDKTYNGTVVVVR